jgi:hypothetical protein
MDEFQGVARQRNRMLVLSRVTLGSDVALSSGKTFSYLHYIFII